MSALFSTLVEEYELVVADVSNADFIDGSILGVLRGADLHARVCGHRFRLQMGTTPVVETAVRVLGIDVQLQCRSSREEALAS